MIALRDYQCRGIDATLRLIDVGIRRVLIVSPTGSGKTVVASALINHYVRELGKQVLFLAHRREILKQTAQKLYSVGLSSDSVGMIAPGFPRSPYAPIQVASVQTLGRRQPPPADLVVIDEAHHTPATSYQTVLSHYAGAVQVGLTATPIREDGKGLGDCFDSLVTLASPRELIDAGNLVDYTIYTHPRKLDLSSARGTGNDYNERKLARLLDQADIVGDLVDHYRRYASGLKAIAFCVDVDHSRHVADTFNAAGIPAAWVSGGTPSEERDRTFAALARGDILVVANCQIATEGWDCPSVKCLIMARPTDSLGLWLQMAGRVLRPDHENPAQRAVILDHSGNALRHGLPCEDRFYDLEGVRKRPGGAPPVKSCEGCYRVIPASARVCPYCGFAFGSSVTVEQTEGTLTPVEKNEQSEVERLRATCHRMAFANDKRRGAHVGTTAKKLKDHLGTALGDRSEEELRRTFVILKRWLDEPLSPPPAPQKRLFAEI